jgi:hypothetical protein
MKIIFVLEDREKDKKQNAFCLFNGADDGTRTRNLLITSQLLYQLSYIGIYGGADGN